MKNIQNNLKKVLRKHPCAPSALKKEETFFLPMHAYCGMCKMWQTPDNYEMSYLQNGNNRKTKSDYIIKKKSIAEKKIEYTVQESAPQCPRANLNKRFLPRAKTNTA